MTKKTILVVLSGEHGVGMVADHLDQMFWQYKADTKKHLIPVTPSPEQLSSDYWNKVLFDIIPHTISSWSDGPACLHVSPEVMGSRSPHCFTISVVSRSQHERYIAMHCIADCLRLKLGISDNVRLPDPGNTDELFQRGTAAEQALEGLFSEFEITFFYKAPCSDYLLYTLLGQVGVPPVEMGNY